MNFLRVILLLGQNTDSKWLSLSAHMLCPTGVYNSCFMLHATLQQSDIAAIQYYVRTAAVVHTGSGGQLLRVQGSVSQGPNFYRRGYFYTV